MEPLVEAFARVWARPRLVLALAALNVLFTIVAAHPLSSALAPAIDLRPGAGGLLSGDDGLYAELLLDNPAIGRVAASGAELAVLVYGLLAWLLAGGILATLARPHPLPPGGVLAATLPMAARSVVRSL